MESLGNFTPRAQQVLSLARKEADRLNHNFVGTEHLLLGLIKLGQGAAVNVLQKMGLDLETVRQEVEKQVGVGPDQQKAGRMPPYTPRVRKVIALAQEEARALNHTYVGTEHLLLGLLREGEGVAGKIMRALEIDLEQTRKEILGELDPNFSASRLEQRLKMTAQQTTPKEAEVAPPQAPAPATAHAGSVDTSKRYDVYCVERNAELVVYRNARFKGIRKLFREFMSAFIELELADGQTLFVAPHSVIKFCETGANPGGEPVSLSEPQPRCG